jgi:tRNA 2-thiouridine synthesizing protein B
MSKLHTVNKSPFDRTTLESCLRLVTKGDAVLLLEDGVYGAMAGTAKSAMVEKAMNDVSVYVLGPDLKARGVDEGRLIAGVKVVGYDGFVDLTTDNDAVSAWL